MIKEGPAAVDSDDIACWRTSSYSGGQGDCVEIADNIPGAIPVRDSKRPTGPVITFTPRAWEAFVTRLG